MLERAGLVLGFCKVTRQAGRAAHVAHLSTLAVSPLVHGTGVALELVEQIAAMAGKQGILRLELTVEADNPRALSFYRKQGFEEEGRMRAAYKRAADNHFTDEILMAKLLGDLPRGLSRD